MIGYILIAIIVVLILLPPKYDPAVRLKEWAIEQKEKEQVTQISSPYYERVMALADQIENTSQGEVPFGMSDFGWQDYADQWITSPAVTRKAFNMASWGFSTACGTVACIAGTAALAEEPNSIIRNGFLWTLEARPKKRVMGVEYRATYFLGLEDNPDVARALFMGMNAPVDREYIKPIQAAETLRHYAETGKVSWPKGFKRAANRRKAEK